MALPIPPLYHKELRFLQDKLDMALHEFRHLQTVHYELAQQRQQGEKKREGVNEEEEFDDDPRMVENCLGHVSSIYIRNLQREVELLQDMFHQSDGGGGETVSLSPLPIKKEDVTFVNERGGMSQTTWNVMSHWVNTVVGEEEKGGLELVLG